MIEFNKVSNTSNFIKQLLNKTYLPVIRTVNCGDFIIKDRLYLFKCDIIKCNETGYLAPYKGSTLTPIAVYSKLGEYHFGEKNGKLCHNFQSNREGYDSLTHERLGDYLRALRDMYSLNLMPLYNCFSNNPLENYHIFNDGIMKTARNYNTKIYKVPIRFNTDYTICMENVGITTFAPAFIKNEHLLKINKTQLQSANIDPTNRYLSLYNNTNIYSYGNLRFNQPIKLRFNNVPEIRQVTNSVPTGRLEINAKSGIKFDVNSCYEAIPFEDVDKYKYVFVKDLSEDGQLIMRLVNGEKTNDNVYYISTLNPSHVLLFERADDKPSLSVSGTTLKVSTTESVSGTTLVTTDKDLNVYNYTELTDNKGVFQSTDSFVDLTKTYYPLVAEWNHIKSSYSNVGNELDKPNYDLINMFDSIEDSLYLLIQIPENFKGNIVILEGDYTSTQSEKRYNEVDLREYPENYLDSLFISDLRLMRMNINIYTPFSDTLEQFLLWNAICNLDTINLDMDRLLSTLSDLGISVDNHYYANYWYYRYREIINHYIKDTKQGFADDNLGYVTTEIESILNKGRY